MMDESEDSARACSNRTFMELKFSLLLVSFKASISSNRTFMELKFISVATTTPKTERTNRTFMELISEIILSRYSELIPTFKNIKE